MLSEDELRRLAKSVADHAVGEHAVEKVEVEADVDFDGEPTYVFSLLIDERKTNARLGLVHIRLVQSLWDALLARSDSHYPVVRLFDSKDWASRSVA